LLLAVGVIVDRILQGSASAIRRQRGEPSLASGTACATIKNMCADLFDPHAPDPHRPAAPASGERRPRPLADRLRPSTLDEVVGHAKLLAPGGPFRPLLESDRLPSLLFWGPPGCGKTTLARLVAGHTQARFLEYSAVRVGSKELKEVMAESERLERATGQRTVLFLDEIHRFNKAQQDSLLPWVERGDITLIGATTENPSFEVNAALLSRMRLFVLEPLNTADVHDLLVRALAAPTGLADREVAFTDAALDALAELSEGDARQALGLLDTVTAVVQEQRRHGADAPADPVDVDQLDQLIQHRAVRYDKAGDEHYNLISALHKSLRNSDAQASIYWLGRMLAGGEDPLYLARRLVRFASEDVGLADPHALPQALAARDAVHFLGLPEGALALTQAAVYLALAPKSNALYTGYKSVEREVARGHNPPVPLHLRNAPTRTMKELGYGKDYQYAHDTTDGIAAMRCLPDALLGRQFYQPGGKGWERELRTRLERIEAWHRDHDDQPAAQPEPPAKGTP
jgi:putative ATPase